MEFNKEMMTKKLESIREKLDNMVISNPIFEELFYTACKNSIGMTGREDYKVEVYKKGKIVCIYDEATNIVCQEELRNNRHINATIIFADGDSLVCKFNSGTLFKSEDLKRIGENLDDKYCAVLNTYYSHDIYDKDGIELSHSWFSDSYELTGKYENIDIRTQTLTDLHEPTFSYNRIPKIPKFCNSATAGCVYRTYANLGMAYQTFAKGIKFDRTAENLSANVYSVNTSYPERLEVIPYSVAIWKDNKMEYEVREEFGNNLEIASNILKEKFKAGIESSKTKEENPTMYKKLIAILSLNIKNN